jgi:hypothetical protein
MAKRSVQTVGKGQREQAKQEKRERKQQKKAAAAPVRVRSSTPSEETDPQFGPTPSSKRAPTTKPLGHVSCAHIGGRKSLYRRTRCVEDFAFSAAQSAAYADSRNGLDASPTPPPPCLDAALIVASDCLRLCVRESLRLNSGLVCRRIYLPSLPAGRSPLKSKSRAAHSERNAAAQGPYSSTSSKRSAPACSGGAP